MSMWAISRSILRLYVHTGCSEAILRRHCAVFWPSCACRRMRRMSSATPAASIRFATRADGLGIAEMSRDFIEHGLGWSWTRERILRSLRHRDTNAIVAVREADRAGFGIMKYGDEEAHLLLLAVKPAHRRCGVGSAMVEWLERCAEVAGVC